LVGIYTNTSRKDSFVYDIHSTTRLDTQEDLNPDLMVVSLISIPLNLLMSVYCM